MVVASEVVPTVSRWTGNEKDPVVANLAKIEGHSLMMVSVRNSLGALASSTILLGLSVVHAQRTNEHWAFQKPTQQAIPAVSEPSWPRGASDHFVQARLDRLGHRPAPEADRYIMIRRLSLDLIGLPPTPAEVNAFIQDQSPDALERVVDRLLCSPHYGEHWALWWLDAVRYADTNGYEIDRPRSIWPYRDWVIDALNSAMPFDRFTVEQLAGDMLPEATLAQRIATGFHRHTYMNEEGGHDWEQFRFESIVDRVHTTATVFLGLTLACAQCHDHKYDPITQKEYWQFFAFLNNVDEPFLEVPVPRVVHAREKIQRRIVELEASRGMRFPLPKKDAVDINANDAALSETERRKRHLERCFSDWLARESAQTPRWTMLEPMYFVSKMNATISRLDDHSLLVSGDHPEIDEYRVVYRNPLGIISGLLLEALPHHDLPKHGPGRGSVMEDGSFALSEFVISTELSTASDLRPPGKRSVGLKDAAATHHEKDRTIDKAIDGDKLTCWHTQGRVGRAHWAVFACTDPVILEKNTEIEATYLMNFLHQQTLGRFRLSVTDDPRPLTLPAHPREILDLLASDNESLAVADREMLRAYYLSVAPELAELNQQIETLRASLPEIPTTLVVRERTDVRTTQVHTRGEFLRPEDEVTPAVPVVLHSLPQGVPSDRLGMARWLVSSENPLTSRVIMNQIWQALFGRGLVFTVEDFGIQGQPPTHPDLLDWLAVEFVRQGWSLKAMQRQMVTSSVYRQSGRTAKSVDWDPENLWLAGGPRQRVRAEVIRDITLVASGMLSPTIGGPSVYPPRPDLKNAIVHSDLGWLTSEGPDRYRRGLYTHRKRGCPDPALAVFDAPPRNTCVVKRRRSNTPLQALTQLNDQRVMEASAALAQRILGEGSDDDASRMAFAFQLCATRPPDSVELDALLSFYHKQRARLQSGELDVAAITGNATTEDNNWLKDLAAWSMVARALFNLDEVISKE